MIPNKANSSLMQAIDQWMTGVTGSSGLTDQLSLWTVVEFMAEVNAVVQSALTNQLLNKVSNELNLDH